MEEHEYKNLPGRRILAGVGVILLGGILALLFMHRPVIIVDDGQARQVESRALSVGWALGEAGIVLSEVDGVNPGLSESLPWEGAKIEIRRARPVSLWQDGAGLVKTWRSVERVPARLLAEAGLVPDAGTQIWWNGAEVGLDQPLPKAGVYLLQLRAPRQAALTVNGVQKNIVVSQASLGSALWALGLRLSGLDRFSPGFDAPLEPGMAVTIRPAVPFRVAVDGREILGHSSANSVGQALAQTGIILQGLDYVLPAEDQPLPADGRVRVVRVREQIELQSTTIPFKTVQVADANTELDQASVVQTGQVGVRLGRVRIRFEDGKEVSRQKEAEWVASPPRDQKNGYGTKIVIRKLDTPDGRIEYWRKVTVYATSFAPCNFIQFIGKCSYTTAAGYTLQKGVIGVGEAWYQIMKGWGVYIDGYGPAKVGDYGYVPGFWVDLGYSDADFVNWHRNTTLYFLTPVPANVPWILPK